MREDEVQQLQNGLYKLTWVNGGSSYASVGRLTDETPWFAPANWSSRCKHDSTSTEWTMVERVESVSDNNHDLHHFNISLNDIRSKLAGLHFGQECLSPDERKILRLAEALLTYIDKGR